jgi:hypothetical protein
VAQTQTGTLQYLDSDKVVIAGTPCSGMTIRTATGGILGDLHGFLVDPIGRQLRYLVVGTLNRTRFLPFSAARVDTSKREIEVKADERDFRGAREVFPALATIASH